jgi:N-dimethylarginine dimethylaminohydrolase
MTSSAKTRAPIARGCSSETGRLRKAILCPPSNFRITTPINHTQWQYYIDGLPKPQAPVMVLQHRKFREILEDEGVEVRLLPAITGLPYQHATRDVGLVIDDTIVVSNLKEPSRRREALVAEPELTEFGLKIICPDRGFLEGGDVVLDSGKIFVGIGCRTDEHGAEFLDRRFGRDHDVIPLHFHPHFTHLDTILGIVGPGVALIYAPAFDPPSLNRIKASFKTLISLTKEEQNNAGANVLCLAPGRLLAAAENVSVNRSLAQLGYSVITTPFSEVLKSGGSVRCDSLPIERDG